ncbi:Glutamate--tRNA ligase [Cytospora mali]|uniref:Glutamate--tRNA ligase, mitochondrial n=1 Tax=Cytospora mali TaxID=578113 RepID=A0A194UZ77_CYTMA|nr:Glutamate--tRNA ligase [Valsa mali var. pyri (nom. inval.)]
MGLFLPDSPARTRFAPSPTGYLHLGSLRTALFNYLLAQATGGQFIIRLEDTDQTRFVEDAEQRLYQDLTWAGLSWDEGPDRGGPYGPYKQSDRLDLYRQHASMLLERDHAFRCFCSKEELEFNLKQSTSSGATAHYPGTCTGISQAESNRRAANGEPHTIRFKSSETPVSAPDLVYGAYKKAEREDNFIIMKSDGYPTYHFANVVDDHFMKITHVIRGAEWLISTPKHVELYNAFGWQPPNFAHVGLLVDQQRQKLSKRDIDNIGISVFRDTKVLPEALLNFSVLLGWDPGLQNKPHLDKRGRLTLDEMKQNLKYFQNRFIRDLISGEVADPPALGNRILKPIQAELQRLDEKLTTHKPRNKTSGSVLPAGMDEFDFLDHLSTRMDLAFEETYIHAVLKAWKGPIDDHSQFIRDNMYAFWSPSKLAYKDSFADLQDGMRRIVLRKQTRSLENTDISRVLLHFRNRLALIPDDEWTLEEVGNRAKELVDAVEYYDTKKEQIMNHGAGWRFFRWALFNGMSGLSVVPMMLILGREETLQRLREARRAAARREEVALNAMKEKMQELKDSRVRIAYLGNPKKEDTKQVQVAEVMEARNVKVAIKKDDPEETISDTEHFLRAMHEARPDQGPFPSQVPIREYTLNASPPVQFLDQTEFKSGYRSLLHGTNNEGQRDRRKQMRPDYRLKPLGSIPQDMVAPGPGPFYAGSVVDHPLRPPFPNRAVHAGAAENERRVRQDMDKASNVSLAEAEKNLQRSWLERGDK